METHPNTVEKQTRSKRLKMALFGISILPPHPSIFAHHIWPGQGKNHYLCRPDENPRASHTKPHSGRRASDA